MFENTTKKIEERNIPESVKAKEETVENVSEKTKGLLEKMKNRITRISDFTGISEKDVLEMTGLENDIIEQLDNPGKFADKIGGIVEYLNNSSDADIDAYLNHFNLAIDSVDPKESPSKFFKFVSENHIPIKLGFLVLYLSTMPIAFAEDMFTQDIEIDYNGENISLEDLMKNPEFQEAIKPDIPIDVLQAYSTNPLSNEDGFALNFAISHAQDGTEVIGVNMMGTYDVQGDAEERQEDFKKINDLLLNITEGHNYSNNAGENKMTTEEFENNRGMLVTEIASVMNISPEEVSDHFDKLFEVVENPTEKVSVVSLEDFNLDESIEPRGEIQTKYDEIINKFNIENPEEKENAIKEFESWGEENGHENVWSALSQEKLDNPFSTLDSHEGKGVMNNEIYGKFIVNELEERGYDIKELQTDHEKAIEAIFDFIVERQGLENDKASQDALKISLDGWNNLHDGKNIDDLLSGEKVAYLPNSIDTFENDANNEGFREELIRDALDNNGLDIEKLNALVQENPSKAITIIANIVENEFNENQGFDSAKQSAIFMGMKNTLGEMGLKGLDEFIVTQTTSEDGKVISQLITPTKDGNFKTSYIDFSLIENNHLEEKNITEKVTESHNAILEKIKELNIKSRIENLLKK